jgi:hypothetical protein
MELGAIINQVNDATGEITVYVWKATDSNSPRINHREFQSLGFRIFLFFEFERFQFFHRIKFSFFYDLFYSIH